MKHVSILVPRGAILGSLEGTRQLLTQVNHFFASRGEGPVFNVQLVGIDKTTMQAGGLYTINADAVLEDIDRTDLIIVPAVDGEIEAAIARNRELLPWITKQYNKGAEVASLCMGAFIVASTGLLNGKRCATHWLAENDFRRMFPDVELVTERIITDEHRFYSSGGALSYMNLILHLIEKYAGRDMTILTAKVFAIEIERDNQLSFIIFQGQKVHEDEPIKKAQEFIETNFQEKITVDQVASMVALSRRNFERRFKKATANTVTEYIQRVKIEAVKKHLETNKKSINELVYDVGYSDIKAFRTVFRKVTGLSPVEYRNKYYREVV